MHTVHWMDERHATSEDDTTRLIIEDRIVDSEGSWFLPAFDHHSVELDSSERVVKTYIPLDIADISKTRAYNYWGKAITYPEYQN